MNVCINEFTAEKIGLDTSLYKVVKFSGIRNIGPAILSCWDDFPAEDDLVLAPIKHSFYFDIESLGANQLPEILPIVLLDETTQIYLRSTVAYHGRTIGSYEAHHKALKEVPYWSTLLFSP